MRTEERLSKEIDKLYKRIEALESKEFAILQEGSGVPAHNAAEGILYWDRTNDVLYVNNNAAAGWTALN
jgi:hypothetical protein